MRQTCVYLIEPYVIRSKGKKENLNMKAVPMIYPVTEWLKIAQYDDKKAISLTDLVETMC